MINQLFIRYQLGDRPFEKLSPHIKVALFLVSITLLMLSYDIYWIAPLFVLHYGIYKFFVPKAKGVTFIIRFALLMNVVNIVLFYLVNPVIGTEGLDTYHVLFSFNEHYVVTSETLLFFVVRLLKIFGTLFISLWFVLSITPSQLAAGLNKLGVPYKICSMISLSLRYIPDVHREFIAIKESMQMRGLELDKKKASLIKRLKATIHILLPLILSSFEKVDMIANAMELRGYGQGKKRTYYASHVKSEYDKYAKILLYAQLVGIGIMILLNVLPLIKKG